MAGNRQQPLIMLEIAISGREVEAYGLRSLYTARGLASGSNGKPYQSESDMPFPKQSQLEPIMLSNPIGTFPTSSKPRPASVSYPLALGKG
ncbi:hypothetical protein Peur_033304 [Populus x canadensis]